ncbi:unnamed protein product [Ilex paraguariensis]|uniref:HMG box domain-containing protein n=1 Tax=Ilex paraguariensis TaxID=185542 RepID=A0ABC8RLN0_9AQUA
MDDHHLEEIYPTPSSSSSPSPSPSTPASSSIPLHLSGFLTGDTIQVQGDTENLQFSVQFNVHHKHNSDSGLHQNPSANIPKENQTSLNSSSSSYMTPNANHVDEDRNANAEAQSHAIDWIPKTEGCNIVTRLGSGVLSLVTYYPSNGGLVRGNLSARNEGVSRKKVMLKRVLRRHSFPISSYTFFVMTTWGMVRSSSFGEASQRLSEMWCNLPHNEKKVLENMAFKDNTRYQRQCFLLRSHVRD